MIIKINARLSVSEGRAFLRKKTGQPIEGCPERIRYFVVQVRLKNVLQDVRCYRGNGHRAVSVVLN